MGGAFSKTSTTTKQKERCRRECAEEDKWKTLVANCERVPTFWSDEARWSCWGEVKGTVETSRTETPQLCRSFRVATLHIHFPKSKGIRKKNKNRNLVRLFHRKSNAINLVWTKGAVSYISRYRTKAPTISRQLITAVWLMEFNTQIIKSTHPFFSGTLLKHFAHTESNWDGIRLQTLTAPGDELSKSLFETIRLLQPLTAFFYRNCKSICLFALIICPFSFFFNSLLYF